MQSSIKISHFRHSGKTRRLKQAKDEATEEIEKYRQERERQFKDFEHQVCQIMSNIFKIVIYNFDSFCFKQHVGSREGVATRIDKDAKQKLEEMTRALASNKDGVIKDVLRLVYDIEPKLHKNYRQ